MNNDDKIPNSFMDYMEYLYVNDLELDDNGNEVPKDKSLILKLDDESDEDEE